MPNQSDKPNKTGKQDAFTFGQGDASFLAAGGETGIHTLCADFYAFMDTLPEAKAIRDMHPDDLDDSIDRLAAFLCGWLGGPRRYAEKYGGISIPQAHAHLTIDASHRDAWLLCMQHAAKKQAYTDAFQKYLLTQLAVPAQRILQVSQ